MLRMLWSGILLSVFCFEGGADGAAIHTPVN